MRRQSQIEIKGWELSRKFEVRKPIRKSWEILLQLKQ